MKAFFSSVLIVASLLLSSAQATQTPPQKKIRIGLSMDTLKEERWQGDRDHMVQRAKRLGAEVLVQAANGNDSLQSSQAENLLTQGIDVLIVVPHNGVTAASIVRAAHKANVKVIAYDRLINNADVDLYMSFDNVEVGRMQAAYLLSKAPKGNYVLIGGAPTDHNAKMFREGQMKALQPAIDRGDVKIVADQWARDWLPSEALKHTENALTKNQNAITAIVASNDSTAGGAIAALKQQKLDGKILVSGQDAELAACQRIIQGSQTMTVYKPTRELAYQAIDAAVAFAQGKPVAATQSVNNGKKEVPALLLKAWQVDKANIKDTVIKDGYHKAEEVFKSNPQKDTVNAT